MLALSKVLAWKARLLSSCAPLELYLATHLPDQWVVLIAFDGHRLPMEVQPPPKVPASGRWEQGALHLPAVRTVSQCGASGRRGGLQARQLLSTLPSLHLAPATAVPNQHTVFKLHPPQQAWLHDAN